VPPNVHFIIDDATDRWLYPENEFDYVHTRLTLGCWADFKEQIARKAFDHLKPGGWFESQELSPRFDCDDNSMPADWPPKVMFDELIKITEDMNRGLDMAPGVKRAYEEAGFVDVQERVFRMPISGWPRRRELKELGQLWQENLQSGVSGFVMGAFHRVKNMKREEIELALIEVRRRLRDRNVHAYQKLHVVWGRKPESVP
jgi:metalloendopeptidase OMA1, mitochondrial